MRIKETVDFSKEINEDLKSYFNAVFFNYFWINI